MSKITYQSKERKMDEEKNNFGDIPPANLFLYI
jgi:hypothetical protein